VPRRPHVVYFALAAVDTVLAGTGRTRARLATKPLLMPALMLSSDRATRRALALCGAGDVALLGTGRAAFTTGLGLFLGGHLGWIAALRSRDGVAGLLRQHPLLATPYLAAWLGLNGFLWRRTGDARMPVVVYSAVLSAMALVALDSGAPATASGGALFMVSDSLLALDRFGDVHLPGHEGWVMASYCSAQALLAI
jgi:uncharacterized membrane protein YhhN